MRVNGWMLSMVALGSVPSGNAQGQQATPTPEVKGVKTVGDALPTLNGASPQSFARAPVPLGNPGQWFGPNAYPPAAIRAGAQGRVGAQVAVDKSGRVTGCTLAVSSGWPDLDAATCNIATQHMSFTPARDAEGKAVAGQYRLAVNWRLPVENTTPVATTLVSVGADGAVLSCASTTPTPLGDICGAFPTGRKLDVPASMRGKVFAIGTVVRSLTE